MTLPLPRRHVLVAALGAACGTAIAQTAAAQDAPLPGTRLAGQGLLRFFGLAVYTARLWVSPGFQAEAFADQPLALELDYLRSLSGSAIAERSLDEMRRVGPIAPEKATAWLQQLKAVIPDVNDGDRLTGLLRPGEPLEFVRGKGTARHSLGKVGDAEFAQRFIGIWLAPTTSEPSLRLALLTQAIATK